MIKTKKVVVFVFAMVLAVLMSVPANADILSSSKVTATIDGQLQSLMEEVSADEKIPVDIWLYETSTIEEREQRIFSKIGVNKAQIESDIRGAISSEKVDEYIMTERSMYAAEREQQYALIRKDYANIQGLQDMRSADTRLFFSQYAPMISAELTSAEIKTLARDNRIHSIYYSPHREIVDHGNVSVPFIGADYTRDVLGFTGAGVNIGMIESTLPDVNKSCLVNADIIYDETLGDITASDTSDHASMVAAIMVGQETIVDGVVYEGIVPDATLYATYAKGSEEWQTGIEWLISQGVHVINMSAGFQGASYYQAEDKWADHITANHNVHFVVSAGNSPLGVTSPGMAYNAITVGSIDDKNTSDESDDSLEDTSSYVERKDLLDGTIPTNKPDLVAPGANITTAAGTNSGTSFAAPHVTAVVAQLCQRFWMLRTMPAGVKSMLTASISHSELAYDTSQGDSIMYDRYGAGVVNAKAVFETTNAYRMANTTFAAGSTFGARKEYTFTATAGQHIRVSLTWLMSVTMDETLSHINYTPSDLDLVNLNLCVYHPNGMLFGEWRTDNFNTEIADFFAPETGTYRIAVCLRESISEKVEFGVAWWLAPTNNLSNSN